MLVCKVWDVIPAETLGMLERPEMYTGAASTKALEIAKAAETYLKG